MLKIGNVLFLGEKDKNYKGRDKHISGLDALDFDISNRKIFQESDIIIYEEVQKNGSLKRNILKNRYGRTGIIKGVALADLDIQIFAWNFLTNKK